MHQSKHKIFVAHVYDKEQIDDLRDAIGRAVKGTPWQPIYADERVISGHILFDKITPDIAEADFSLFEISNQTRSNVFIELGIAIGLGKPVYLLVRRGVELPSDLGGLDRIVYESYKELSTLMKQKLFGPALSLALDSSQRKPEDRLLRKYLRHTYHVNAIRLTAVGDLLASVSGDRKAIVWKVATGGIEAVLKHDGWVGSVDFGPQNRYLATSDGNGIIRLWNLNEYVLLTMQSAHQGACRTLRFAPGKPLIASGGGDAKIQFWQFPDLGKAFTLEGHDAEVRCLAFSPDGEWLVSGGEDGTVCLWSLAGQSYQRILESPNNIIRSVAYSPDGNSVAAVDGNGVVWLYDTVDGVSRWRVQSHEGPTVGLGFHPDGRIVATGGQDKQIRFWDVNTGQLIDTISGHQDTVTCLAFARNGNWLFSGSRDKSVCLWRV